MVARHDDGPFASLVGHPAGQYHDLATTVAVDGGYGLVGKIEAGLRHVTDTELWLLARVLGCPVADLLPRNARSVVPVLRQGED